jgi:hypothetical protein
MGIEVLDVVQRHPEERDQPQDIALQGRLRGFLGIVHQLVPLPGDSHGIVQIVEVLGIRQFENGLDPRTASVIERILQLGVPNEFIEIDEEVRALNRLDRVGREPLGFQNVGRDVEVGARIERQGRAGERGNPCDQRSDDDNSMEAIQLALTSSKIRVAALAVLRPVETVLLPLSWYSTSYS